MNEVANSGITPNRWSREYLHGLQFRSKWKQEAQDQIKPGLLVLVKEANVPTLQWPLERVFEVHPGRDGVVRVATVKMRRYVYKRPVIKLCVLPMD